MPPGRTHYPPEIVSLVCDEIEDRATVARLARVSRTFLAVALDVLYHTIDLRGLPQRRVRFWLSAVARKEHLAARVQSLTIELPHPLSMQVDESEAFAKAFRACVNLKELDISYPGTNPVATTTWMLADCAFRLTTFVNSYFAVHKLGDFLIAQTELRVVVVPHLSCSWGISRGTFSRAELPNLVALCAPMDSCLTALENRPLKRIKTAVSRMDLDPFENLESYSTTLTTLDLFVVFGSPYELDQQALPVDIIRAVGDACPALCHLVIRESRDSVDGMSEIEQRWPSLDVCLPTNTAYFVVFTNLQTFAFLGSFLDEEGMLLDTVRAIAEAQPKLRRVVIGKDSFPGGVANGPEGRSCTATREVVGGLITLVEVDYMVAFEDVSMFWVE